MRRLSTVSLPVAVFFAGCSLIVPGPDSFEFRDASLGIDAAPDSQVAPGDAGPDASLCAVGLEDCLGECVDTQTSVEHCGACGSACAESLSCDEGECLDPSIQVAAAWVNTCSRSRAGQVHCWGSNDMGQVGAGIDDSVVNAPNRVPLPLPAVDVATGGPIACAVTSDGAVWCWGSNDEGQLGDRALGSASRVPVRVPRVADATRVVAGLDHACALIRDGSVLCWGSNEHGQLGDGTFEPRDGPVAVGLDPADAQSLRSGDGTICVTRSTGRVYCWGAQVIGDGTMEASSEPRAVALGRVSDSTGGGALHCAITDEVSCWGTGGSLLRGEASGPWFVPTAVPSPEPSDVSQLAVFSFLTRFATIQFGAHACALHVDGSVSCWGTNWTGELGNGTTDPADAPSPVELPLEAVSVAVGTLHSCAVLADGSVHCWGANASGQLGTGSLADQLAPSRTILLPERP